MPKHVNFELKFDGLKKANAELNPKWSVLTEEQLAKKATEFVPVSKRVLLGFIGLLRPDQKAKLRLSTKR